MEKELFQIENQEKEPKKVIVEIGPGDRALIWRMRRTDNEASYGTGEESLFKIKPGDTFIEVDLPPERSVDVFRTQIHGQEKNWSEGKLDSHLKSLKENLDKQLPKGVRGEVLHADGQKLPFEDGSIDVIFMANVLGGHVKDDKMLGFEAGQKRIFREKENLIKEARRVLKVNGKLIIEEEYAPAESVNFVWDKIMKDLEKEDSGFRLRDLTEAKEIFTLELTKI
ncbi:MAG: methyltransferase domain-containing protein [Candidatus Taylorbacteria bacterium]|nr:methyltransferase domain-containing protein [Candidatus Taylorbacteria bacterium]